MLVRRVPSTHPWSSPSDTLEAMRREMTRLFEDWNAAGFSPAGVFPQINVSETADAILVQAEVPGIRPQDIEVRVENQTLTLSGERKPPAEMENASLHRREREWGRFRRSLSLPVRVDANQVKARSSHGILNVELPKAAETRPKQITVQVGS